MALRTKIFSFLLLAVSFYTKGQERADTAFEKTVFWSVSGNGLKDTSWLYGTAHPVFREDILMADTVLHSLIQSSAVYFENIPSANDDSLYRELCRMDRPKLRRLLGNACYELLVKFLSDKNDSLLNDPQFLQLSPQYYITKAVKHAYGPRMTSVDAFLISIAAGNDQPMYALDSPEMRAMMTKRVSLQQQADNLYFLLNDFEKRMSEYENFIKRFTQKYYAGEIGFLFTQTNYVRYTNRLTGMSYLSRQPSGEELLDKRNSEWLPVIEKAAQKGKTFFAFGAAHLAGIKGIISLLRKKGYTVTPVMLL